MVVLKWFCMLLKMLGAEKPVGYQVPISIKNKVATLNLPSSIDWRNNNGNFVTPVKNQGGCGSCVAFGTMAVMESMFAIEQSMLLNFSEAASELNHFLFCQRTNLEEYL
jgi:C1A family cysteine protease